MTGAPHPAGQVPLQGPVCEGLIPPRFPLPSPAPRAGQALRIGIRDGRPWAAIPAPAILSRLEPRQPSSIMLGLRPASR